MTVAGWPYRRPDGPGRRALRNVVRPAVEVGALVWAGQRLGEPVAAALAVVLLGHLVLLSLCLLLRHDSRRGESGKERPRVLSTLWRMPKARVVSWEGDAGVVYLVREKLRRDGAAARDLAHERGHLVRIPMRLCDPWGKHVTEVPDLMPARFEVLAQGGVLLPAAEQPEVLGDFVTFWGSCIAGARDGSLEVLRRGTDVCLSTSVVEPPNGQVLVLMAESDWDLVRRCRPAASAPALTP